VAAQDRTITAPWLAEGWHEPDYGDGDHHQAEADIADD
jgi:hypothetical protein